MKWKIYQFVKKYWLPTLIVLVIITFTINRLLEANKPPTSSPAPTIPKTANYKSIVPGTTNIDEINELLGFPVKRDEKNGRLFTEYRSANEFRNHIVIYENNIATIIKEVVISSEEKTATSVVSEFGIAPYILYSSDPSSVFDLYVYPESGIAYLGGHDGTLLEVWYFTPTTIDEFISKWATDYSKEKTTRRLPY